mmetsp:Transcript_39921/g.48654  ORF Transcript_39921/g.48654 Transcript_39921/m.48654 type:complete len:98 (-) Transcript_39921:227-520(-)
MPTPRELNRIRRHVYTQDFFVNEVIEVESDSDNDDQDQDNKYHLPKINMTSEPAAPVPAPLAERRLLDKDSVETDDIDTPQSHKVSESESSQRVKNF